MRLKKFVYAGLLLLGIVVISACSSSSESQQQPMAPEGLLTPVENISHAHGIAVDIQNKGQLYIATHDGLLLLKNDQELYRIGTSEDDLMGFTSDSINPKVFFSSGHPKEGGNIGVQRSDDGGMNWKKISDGVSGPVDFHSMTLSPANPSLLYGWYGALQRSTDAGVSWEIVPTSLQKVISLTAHPTEEDTLFAATATGLQISVDRGEKWSIFTTELSGNAVTSLAIDPENSQNMLSFSELKGLAYSNDAGKTWKSIPQDLGIVLYMAFDLSDTQTIYSLNKSNQIYKSVDSGMNWILIR